MAQRVVDLAVAGVPVRGPAMDGALELGLAPPEIGAQRLGEQRVVTERRVAAIDGLDRDVALPEPVEHRRGVARIENRVAQRRRQATEDRAPAQERDGVLRDVAEHVAADVLGDQPIGAVEVGHGIRGPALLLDREGREVQTGRPSLGQREQSIDLPGVEPCPRAVDEHGRLQARHRELVRAQLGHLAMGAHPRDGQREVPARGHSQA